MMRARSAWSASGEIRMSTGLPMTCTPMNTITVIASSTNSAWISRRMSQVVIGLPSPWHVVSFPPRLLQDHQAWVRSINSLHRWRLRLALLRSADVPRLAACADPYKLHHMDAPNNGGPRFSTAELLSRLVAYDTTSRNSNLELIGFVRDYLDAHGVAVPRQHRCDRAEGQHPRHHRTAGSRRRRAVGPCRYRAGGWPGVERRSVRAAARRRQAVRARRLRHEGLRRRMPRRGARFRGAQALRVRCICSSATTRKSVAAARSG